jgi:hypothetical protein
MITLPDPSRAPHHGAIDAPIGLVMPKTADSGPYVCAVSGAAAENRLSAPTARRYAPR